MAIDQSIERRLNRLRVWNIAVGLILAVQAAMIAALTNSFALPVTATFMSGPPGTAPALYHWFDIPTGWGVFTFLAISAAALLIIASPFVFPWYKRNLLDNRNYGRWIEYFFRPQPNVSPSGMSDKQTYGANSAAPCSHTNLCMVHCR